MTTMVWCGDDDITGHYLLTIMIMMMVMKMAEMKMMMIVILSP